MGEPYGAHEARSPKSGETRKSKGSEPLLRHGCSLHGEAFTHGCPGCLDYADDLAIAAQVRERMAADTGERLSLHEFFQAALSRRQRIRLYCSWAYIRQTRPFLPLTEWWLNRG